MSEISLESRPAVAPHVRLQIDAVSGDPVLLYPEGLLILNETAHAIVVRCDGSTTIASLAAALAEEYDAPADQLLGEISACLRDLHQRQLIVLAQ